MIKAIGYLGIARLIFARIKPADVEALNKMARAAGKISSSPHDRAHTIMTVQYVMARAAKRVPWRSDCLVQAIAAQKWLASMGVSSIITIGVQKAYSDDFGAHAWLSASEFVVTGGDISDFKPLL